jgi:hypothetical protein
MHGSRCRQGGGKREEGAEEGAWAARLRA